MKSVYKSISIQKIIVTQNYSITGNSFDIILSEKGVTVSINNLSAIKVLSNLDKIKSVKEYFNEFFNVLNLEDEKVDYRLILGKCKAKEYLDYLKSEIDKTVPLVNDYHFSTFLDRVKCYKNLTSVLLKDQILDIPHYDHSGVTGRTTIKKGFNFLTLKKDKRKILKTISGKTLVEVDFKSCEPFFYLNSQNISLEGDDVYNWIAKKYSIDINNREYTKRGFLSMIYGANEKTVSRVMNIKENKVKLIKENLGLTSLKHNLENQFKEKGYVFNYYGRPITSNNNLVNYWIQSSTVDFCSLAFNSFAKKYNLTKHFFIHDSMTFSVDRNIIEVILKVKSLTCPKSGISIPVEFNIIS